jgi:hypothetical protein
LNVIQRLFNAFQQHNLLKTYLLLVVLTIPLLYLLSWPGCLLAAAIAGFFCLKYSRAALCGFLGGLTAWGLLVGLHTLLGGLVALDIFGALAGLSGMGALLAVIIVVIGGLLGLAGSLLGNAIYGFLESHVNPPIVSPETS